MSSRLPAPPRTLSAILIETLQERVPSGPLTELEQPAVATDGVFGEDFQLSLYLLYELHYRGFSGVDERWEWNPSLLALRCELEADFEATLRERLRPDAGSVAPRGSARPSRS